MEGSIQSLIHLVVENPVSAASVGVLVFLFQKATALVAFRERLLTSKAKRIAPLARLLKEKNVQAKLENGAQALRIELEFNQSLSWTYKADEIRYALQFRNPLRVLVCIKEGFRYARLSPEGAMIPTDEIPPVVQEKPRKWLRSHHDEIDYKDKSAAEIERLRVARLKRKVDRFDNTYMPTLLISSLMLGLFMIFGPAKPGMEISNRMFGGFYLFLFSVVPFAWAKVSTAYYCAIELIDSTKHKRIDTPQPKASNKPLSDCETAEP